MGIGVLLLIAVIVMFVVIKKEKKTWSKTKLDDMIYATIGIMVASVLSMGAGIFMAVRQHRRSTRS